MKPFNTDTPYLSQRFSGIDAENLVITGAEFEDCVFTDCNFSDTTFQKCRFIECSFLQCNLSLANFAQSRFAEVDFVDSKLLGIDWTKAAWPKNVFVQPLKFERCKLNDSSFFGLQLDELVIEECIAKDVDFRNGSFNRAKFCFSDFENSVFQRTSLKEADFSEATNYNIDIFQNDISKARFSRFEAISLLNSLDIELVD